MKNLVHALSEVEVAAISIVNKGANRKRFFLRKSAEDPDVELLTSPAFHEPIAKADWSAVYCVVAEPDWLEEAGQLGDNSVFDRWASEDEIRKAAHRFMKNGALVNKMHESLSPYGQLVENAVALADFKVGGHTIRKGSWYVAIEPTDDGKKAIEDGSFTGISIEGTGVRKLVEKAADADMEALWQRIEKAEAFTRPGTANVGAGDRKKLEPLARHYLSKPHPFGACVRDQVSHGLSKDHANRRCAVLLDSFDPKRQRHSVQKSIDWNPIDHPRDRTGRFTDHFGNDAIPPIADKTRLAVARGLKANPQLRGHEHGDIVDALHRQDATATQLDSALHRLRGTDSPQADRGAMLLERELGRLQTHPVDSRDPGSRTQATDPPDTRDPAQDRSLDSHLERIDAEIERTRERIGELSVTESGRRTAPLEAKVRRLTEERRRLVANGISKASDGHRDTLKPMKGLFRKMGAALGMDEAEIEAELKSLDDDGADPIEKAHDLLDELSDADPDRAAEIRDELQKSIASEGAGGTVEDVALTADEKKLLDDLKKSVEDLPAEIAKAMKDGNGNGDGENDEGEGDGDDEPSAAELKKSIDDLRADVKKLGSGRSTQRGSGGNGNGNGDGEQTDADREKIEKGTAPAPGIL